MTTTGIKTGISKFDLSLPLPTEWKEVGKIEKLFIYPLKSARGHLVDQAKVKKNIFEPNKVTISHIFSNIKNQRNFNNAYLNSTADKFFFLENVVNDNLSCFI